MQKDGLREYVEVERNKMKHRKRQYKMYDI